MQGGSQMHEPADLEAWFITGSQHLYGADALHQVASHAATIAGALDAASGIPVRVVVKPVQTRPEEIRAVMLEANASDACVGVITWILDILQTMPTFVYLGPIVLFFGIGSSAAVVATLAYALPPIVRIAGHGIRHVSPTTIEATNSSGQTRLQRLTKVQLPMARATISRCSRCPDGTASIEPRRRPVTGSSRVWFTPIVTRARSRRHP